MAEPTGEAQLGFFPELRGLERDAAALAGKLKAAEAAVTEASGRDPSEQVRVALGTLGRVAFVEVDPRWRTRISPGDLPAAVLAAYREAGIRRSETWAAEIGRTDAGSLLDDRGSMPSAGAGSGPADFGSHESIRRLWHLLQEATDRLDDVVREAAARREAVVTGRDPSGHVTASFSGGGELTDLTVDDERLAEVGDRELGAAITAAIIDGYAVVDRLARESTSRWPFPDLDRLSGSPAALLATLGLPAVAPDDRTRGGHAAD
ncbi:YbaB/EbfC family nucleoid-associated protein [Actinoplanes sp. NPDC049668]|uniref:YbaB/EbfC family nucleoid-associated protein n=1 Tax=unclassified Actinoplanes TaxID=2626549 RepID=UPI0033B603AC